MAVERHYSATVCSSGRDTPRRLTNSFGATRPSGSQINYEKLTEICCRAKCQNNPLTHEEFMREYHLLFLPTVPERRQRAWTVYSAKKPNVPQELPQISRPRSTSACWQRPDQLEEIILRRRLRAMAAIALKYPPLRTDDDIKKLASLLLRFPALLPPDTPQLVREKLAGRITAIKVTERRGLALPREGGLSIILQGSVKETHKNLETGEYSSQMLHIGEVFGEMKEMAYPPKLSYPIYLGEKRSVVMRITLTDMTRSKELVQERELDTHLQFINTSPLLSTFPLHIRQKLAMNIQWKEIPAKTKVLTEGEPILYLSIIKEGKCRVFKSITNETLTTAKVCIGEVGEGTCLGELAIEGCEISPYTITAVTQLHIGQLPIQSLASLELDKLLSSKQQYAISLPSEETLQKLYTEKLISQQWASLRRAIVGEVYKESSGTTKNAF